MFEFAGYLFSISEVIATLIGLLGFNALGVVAIIVLVLKGKKMTVVDDLNSAVDELDAAANALVGAIELYRSAAAVGDLAGVEAAKNRIVQISAALRGETAKFA